MHAMMLTLLGLLDAPINEDLRARQRISRVLLIHAHIVEEVARQRVSALFCLAMALGLPASILNSALLLLLAVNWAACRPTCADSQSPSHEVALADGSLLATDEDQSCDPQPQQEDATTRPTNTQTRATPASQAELLVKESKHSSDNNTTVFCQARANCSNFRFRAKSDFKTSRKRHRLSGHASHEPEPVHITRWTCRSMLEGREFLDLTIKGTVGFFVLPTTHCRHSASSKLNSACHFSAISCDFTFTVSADLDTATSPPYIAFTKFDLPTPDSNTTVRVYSSTRRLRDPWSVAMNVVPSRNAAQPGAVRHNSPLAVMHKTHEVRAESDVVTDFKMFRLQVKLSGKEHCSGLAGYFGFENFTKKGLAVGESHKRLESLSEDVRSLPDVSELHRAAGGVRTQMLEQEEDCAPSYCQVVDKMCQLLAANNPKHDCWLCFKGKRCSSKCNIRCARDASPRHLVKSVVLPEKRCSKSCPTCTTNLTARERTRFFGVSLP